VVDKGERQLPHCTEVMECECRKWDAIESAHLVLKLLLPRFGRFGVLAKPPQAAVIDKLIECELPRLQGLRASLGSRTSPNKDNLLETFLLEFQQESRNDWKFCGSIALFGFVTDAVRGYTLDGELWLECLRHRRDSILSLIYLDSRSSTYC
jgi:hypothetical protein